VDLFRQRFRRDAILGLVPKLNKDSGGGLYAKAASMQLYFFRLRNQLQWIVRLGSFREG